MRQRLIALALAAALAHASEAATITFADPANGDYRLLSATTDTHQVVWQDTALADFPAGAVLDHAEAIVQDALQSVDNLGGLSVFDYFTEQGFGPNDITAPQFFHAVVGVEAGRTIWAMGHYPGYKESGPFGWGMTTALDVFESVDDTDPATGVHHFAVVTPVPEPSALVLLTLVNPVLAIVGGRHRRRIRP
jgi:hypothetical protein